MIGYIILGIIVVFLAILLIRTLMFKPAKKDSKTVEEVAFDEEAAVNNLAELVRCKTISYYDKSLEDDSEFEKLVNKLPSLYPTVIEKCELKRFDGRALLFHWKGEDESLDPAVLMAHYDVVPVEEAEWTMPAFEGLIKDGVLWGRGSLDTKITFNGIMSGAEALLKQGFTPKRSIYFAFSGGEEVSGPGAGEIVKYFQAEKITPYLVVDEGGAVVQDVFPGVKEPCGLIGIAEKGMMSVKLDVASNGGHASAPAPHTPIGILSMACTKIEAHPFKHHFTKPVLEMFDTLGRHSGFVYRMIFANLWCFGGILDMICKKGGGELNALVRTTVAFTQMKGSKAPNVIPPTASMVANIRLNPEDSMESAKKYLEQIIADDQVKVSVEEGMNPSPISRTDCEGWNVVRDAVANTWKGCLVSPYLMVQCSDSRHYAPISDKVYRFSAMDVTAEERHTIHGNDEHVRIETVKHAVEFFIRVMKAC